MEVDGLSILIDAGPDFRQQSLTHGIRRIDAVLITHEHFDHVGGIDDLRPYLIWNRARMPVCASPRAAEILRKRMDYIFVDGSYPGVPNLDLIEIQDSFTINRRDEDGRSVDVNCLPAFHGDLPVIGFRIEDFAYVTDASRLPDETFDRLLGLETLVLSALRFEPHPTHATIDEAVQTATRIGARKTYFIHMTHSILHARDSERLPPGIEFGYDGLEIEHD